MTTHISQVTKIIKAEENPPTNPTPPQPSKPRVLDVPSRNPRYTPNPEYEIPSTEEERRELMKELERKMKENLDRARKETMQDNMGSKFASSNPSNQVTGTHMFDKNLNRTKSDWKFLLDKFISDIPRISKDWDRPDSRNWAGSRLYTPSTKKIKDVVDIVAAIDTSASISTSTIHKFLNEIATIATSYTNVRIRILYWMDSVYQDVEIECNDLSVEEIQQEIKNIPISQNGGTYMSSVAEYLKARGVDEIEGGLIYFTDGYLSDGNITVPEVTKDRILFIIDNGGNTDRLEKFCQEKNIGEVYEIAKI